MTLETAWDIVHEFCYSDNFSEYESFIYEEALNYILVTSDKYYENDDSWNIDVQVASYNLASYYEKIGKTELAIKYFKYSSDYGSSRAKERLEKLL